MSTTVPPAAWLRLGFVVAAWVTAQASLLAEVPPSAYAKDVGQGPIGGYEVTTPAGKPLRVEFYVPEGSRPGSRILIVIPGARRNAGEYRDQWADLANANGFIVLVPGASREHFPTEYEYNAGGVTDPSGQIRPQQERLFSAIEPMFDDFRRRFGSTRESYALYGHSAGGGFVHRFLLMMPDARVDVAVAANPAFCTFPRSDWDYPFGTGGTNVGDDELRAWFAKPLTVLLGDRDIGPRTKLLSNSRRARLQGPSVYARGLGFFQSALTEADRLGVPLRWKLEIVAGVGHSNTHMASQAVKYLPAK